MCVKETSIFHSQSNNPMDYFIDTHCHLHPPFFDENKILKIIEDSYEQSVKKIVSCSSSPESFRFVMENFIPNKLFVTLGMQPTEASNYQNAQPIRDTLSKYSKSKCDERLKAIGEIGLDYYWVKDEAERKKQEVLFKDAIELGTELNLPLVIHTRKAESASLDILEKYAQTTVLLHSFEGNLEQINRALDLGYLVSIPTNIMIRKNRRKVAKRVGLDNMTLETDSPYCGPEQDYFPNTPATIPIAANKIAELLETQIEEVRTKTTNNSEKFYGI